MTTGSKQEFDENWKGRKEAQYNHWVRGWPQNQIQLAFRSHWEVFQDIIGKRKSTDKRVLEVGCGRGSLSSYFAENGWDVTLLDYSQSVLDTAQDIFAANNHEATFVQGDANDLPFPDNTFDVTASIGLLEHFEDVKKPMEEQWRVLKPGGWFLGYIVPERPDNVQRYFNWVNSLLKIPAKILTRSDGHASMAKAPIYRSDFGSEHYLKSLDGLRIKDLKTFGMYPMPMISHSPEFPFSLLPNLLEWPLTRVFEAALLVRRVLNGKHGWICSEEMGQAFLVAFRKPKK